MQVTALESQVAELSGQVQSLQLALAQAELNAQAAGAALAEQGGRVQLMENQLTLLQAGQSQAEHLSLAAQGVQEGQASERAAGQAAQLLEAQLTAQAQRLASLEGQLQEAHAAQFLSAQSQASQAATERGAALEGKLQEARAQNTVLQQALAAAHSQAEGGAERRPIVQQPAASQPSSAQLEITRLRLAALLQLVAATDAKLQAHTPFPRQAHAANGFIPGTDRPVGDIASGADQAAGAGK